MTITKNLQIPVTIVTSTGTMPVTAVSNTANTLTGSGLI